MNIMTLISVRKFPEFAILDWGIGGLGFYTQILKESPDFPVVYLSDSGSTPYGRQSAKELSARLGQIIGFLKVNGVKRLVVACNAMSTVLESFNNTQNQSEIQITGVIRPAVDRLVSLPGEQRIAIVGGRRTILSGAYRRQLGGSGHQVIQRIAQPLSALIERGDADSPVFMQALTPIMKPLRKADCLVLACTHYIAAADSFRKFCPTARLVDPAAETVKWVNENWGLAAKSSPSVFLTTGNPWETARSAEKIFGIELPEILRISVDLDYFCSAEDGTCEK